MPTPLERLTLKRTFEVNPSIAFLNAIGILKDEVSATVALEVGKIKDTITNEIKKELAKEIPDLEKVLEVITGKDGEDALPEDVASELMAMPEFIQMTKAVDGKSVKLSEVVNTLKSDSSFLEIIKGEAGEPGEDAPKVTPFQVAQVLFSNRDFISSLKGEPANPIEIAAILKDDPLFVEKVRGKKGEDGSVDTGEKIIAKINGADPAFLIPASRISGLPRKGKGTAGKYHPAHGGGGDGSGMTLTAITLVAGQFAYAGITVLPKYIATDSGLLKENFGYTRSGSAGNYTITFDIPPQSWADIIS